MEKINLHNVVKYVNSYSTKVAINNILKDLGLSHLQTYRKLKDWLIKKGCTMDKESWVVPDNYVYKEIVIQKPIKKKLLYKVIVMIDDSYKMVSKHGSYNTYIINKFLNVLKLEIDKLNNSDTSITILQYGDNMYMSTFKEYMYKIRIQNKAKYEEALKTVIGKILLNTHNEEYYVHSLIINITSEDNATKNDTIKRYVNDDRYTMLQQIIIDKKDKTLYAESLKMLLSKIQNLNK